MILKRFFAEIIDYFIIGLLFVGLENFNLPEWFYGISFNIADIPITIPSVGVLIVIIPIVIKDLLFKNASIGKKIMGLVIVDDKKNIPSIKSEVNYSMSVLNSLMTKDKKIVNFLGTSKNGTSFLVNNLAAIFDSMGINTAILDMTKNKNSYYIYTNNEERLRKIAHKSINNLKNGFAEGLKVGKNLTVYTSVPGEEIDESNAEAILSTLVQNHSLILIDCDFDTDPAYFAMCQELYLVQSMDVLTIQPLTKYLRDLKTKGVLDSEKIRVVVNKEVKMRTITSKDIIGGLSFYNDPSMSFMTDLFNKDLVKACTIPFDEGTYSRYLDGIAICKISMTGYTKNFMSKLKILAEMVYPRLPQGSTQYNKKNTNYGGNSFSPNINNTLEQMRKKY